MEKDLDFWREKIDALNERILALLNERAQCALKVGQLKRADLGDQIGIISIRADAPHNRAANDNRIRVSRDFRYVFGL